MCVLPSASPAVGAGNSCERGGRIPEGGRAGGCLSEICLSLSWFLRIAYKLTDLFFAWRKYNSYQLFNIPEKRTNDEMKFDTVISISQEDFGEFQKTLTEMSKGHWDCK